MKTYYLDADFHIHTETAPNRISWIDEKGFFNGKSSIFIEGYRVIPENEKWTQENSDIFQGLMIAPWKPYSELDAAQREYERQQLIEANATIAELDAALLDTTYNYLLMEE